MRTSHIVGIVVIAIILIGAAFYFGSRTNGGGTMATTTPDGTNTHTGTDPYSDTSSWQQYHNDTVGFSISYPADFTAGGVHAASSTDWRLNAGQNLGQLSFSLTVPKAFLPQTNFSDAKLTVGESNNAKAVTDCLTPDPSGTAGTLRTKTINGVVFSVFTASDAGAGNIYETTSYRTVHGGMCYAVEYTIHSTQLANYPPEYGLTQFDKVRITSVLDRIVGTFTFL